MIGPWILASILLTQSAVSTGEQDDGDTADNTIMEFSYDFEEANDRNFDRWPDDWTRRRDTGFPRYVKIEIVPRDDGEEGNRSLLQMKLNGGAAEIISPRQRLNPRYSYVLEADLRTVESVDEHNEAWISVRFYDEAGNLQTVYSSQKYKRVKEFTRVRIGPMIPPTDEVALVEVRLHLSPTRPIDLHGAVQVDSIHMRSFPKLLTNTNRPYNMFTDPGEITVQCEISGVDQPDAILTLRTVNARGILIGKPEVHRLADEVARQNRSGEGPGNDESPSAFRDVLRELRQRQGQSSFGSKVKITWTPEIEHYGFYRTIVSLSADGAEVTRREIPFAVIDPKLVAANGNFGWTLPRQPRDSNLVELVDLLDSAGIGWLKYPVWYGRSDDSSADWIAEFAERLVGAGIEVVGLIDQPPPEHAEVFSRADQGIALIMREPEQWKPLLNHVLARLSLRIRWWQLGADDDMSFVGLLDLVSKVQGIRSQLVRFARDAKLGIPWNWLHGLPPTATPPWDVRFNTTEVPFTPIELAEHLRVPRESSNRVWTSLQPLPREHYDLATRVRDLVKRMLEVKIYGDATAFVTRPISDSDGLLNREMKPTDLFVPFRTTASQLAGFTYLGKLQLPNGSENLVFTDGTTAMMVTWNDVETNEEIYLGESITVTDIWGHSILPPRSGSRQIVSVDRWPRFVKGMDLNIARFRMGFRFDREILASTFGKPQPAKVSFENVFPRGMSGNMKLHSDGLWSRPIDQSFKAGSNQRVAREFPIILNTYASNGRHPVRIDFTLSADQRYEFSVFRHIQVGFGLVDMELLVERIDEQRANVHVTLINNSDDSVSFDCMLLLPGHRRQRAQILGLDRGRRTKTFAINTADQMEGKLLWVRAEEVRGNRVINQRFEIEPMKQSSATTVPAD